MLAPRSVALVGASRREGTVGRHMVETLRRGGFPGEVFCVNPRYDEVAGYPCLPSLSDLPAPVDVAVLSVAAQRMEAVFGEAIAAGARSVVLFDPCVFSGDGSPPLLDRLKASARSAGLPVCGGNGMGAVNLEHHAWLSFHGPRQSLPGGIAAICHSGSVYALLLENTRRYRFNLVVSPGQEINASVADYMDYALELASTRVIVLFIETVRDPDGFVAALARARARRVPVVVCKVGRTPASAALAATHSGAVAGSDNVFDAVCETHGAIRCDDLDELMATAQILEHAGGLGAGGLGVVMDSGGLREQLIDLADGMDVTFAPLTQDTVDTLRRTLAHGLEAVNPLDAAGPLDDSFAARLHDASVTLARDPGVALVAHELFVTDGYSFYPSVVDDLAQLQAQAGKPHVLFCSLATIENAGVAGRFRDLGIPVICGARNVLRAASNTLAWREAMARDDSPADESDPDAVAWSFDLLRTGDPGEVGALAIVERFGIATAPARLCGSREAARRAAGELGYPVVAKTAMAGVVHKARCGGVFTGIAGEAALDEACEALASRFGPRIAVAAMAPDGVELAFGFVREAHHGSIVMVSAGGVLVESFDDRVFALAPFGTAAARRMIERLAVARILRGAPGRPPADMAGLATALSRFSVLAAALSERIAEMDVNPVIAGAWGHCAVDAMIVTTPEDRPHASP